MTSTNIKTESYSKITWKESWNTPGKQMNGKMDYQASEEKPYS